MNTTTRLPGQDRGANPLMPMAPRRKDRPRILVVDDEEDVRDLLDYNLRRTGYDIVLARNGSKAVRMARMEPPDLIILDVLMPEMDGLEVCRQIRADMKLQLIPVVMLTALDQGKDQVSGLNAGADVYLVKPVAMEVLVGQIKALLRGVNRYAVHPDIIEIDDLIIDKSRYVVFRKHDGKKTVMHFPKRQFELIHFLASHSGWVFTREELLKRLWENEELMDRTVDVHVRKVRAQLGDEYIETVKGIGYRFRKSWAKATDD